MAETVQHKLGGTRAGERTRIWLQTRRLLDSGFKPGGKYLRIWSTSRLVLVPCTQAEFDKAERDCRGTIFLKNGVPLIDIVSKVVPETFILTHVSVTYGDGKVTIR